MPYRLQEIDRERRLVRRLWIAVSVVFLLAPVPLLWVAPDRGADTLTLVALGFGFIAFAAIVLQLLSPSRLRAFTEPFGIGVLLRLHRWMGTVTLLLVGAHVLFIVVPHHEYLAYLWPVHEPAKARFAFLGALALLLIVGTSLWRRRLRLRYEAWRLLHILLGTSALVAASLHVMLTEWYTGIPMLRWYIVGLVIIGVLALGLLRIFRPFVAVGSPWVVTGVLPERGDATTVQLTALGHGGLTFRPGQFAWIRMAGSAYAITEHPFSVASSACRPEEVSFTIKRLGDFTGRMASVLPGTRVMIDGPHGSWEPAMPHAGFVLLVAGIGITPAMSFLRTFDDLDDGRPIQLVFGARDWDSVTFREELADLATRLELDVRIVLSDPPHGWTGEAGRIDQETLSRVLPGDAAARNILVCGPPAMIDGTLRALRGLGIPDEVVYADRFDSA